MAAQTHPGASYDAQSDWTHTPSVPEIDPCLWLTSVGRVSFQASDLEHFAAWIQCAGWRRESSRSSAEFARFVRGRQLIVAYHTQTLLIQGQHVDATLELLGQLPQAPAVELRCCR